MSKTTLVLFTILFLFLSVFLFVLIGVKQNPIIMSLTKPLITRSLPARTSLSFSTNEETVDPGQTITIPVIIHNPHPHPSVIQVELAYDPTIVTIMNISPGTFFNKPAIALENIDPVAGRISYALHCQNAPFTKNIPDCVNASSSTVATLTMHVMPYPLKNTTELSFFPKTVIRTHEGLDLLQKTTRLQLIIARQQYPSASSSAINQFIPIAAPHPAERK